MSTSTLRSRLPDRVTVVEVGPRDGLQNQPEIVPSDVKAELVERLAASGCPVVEVTSFVRPDLVPQLADAADVFARVERRPGTRYPVLVPNLKGLERAIATGAEEVAVFASATETFSLRNINRTRQQAHADASAVCERAQREGLRVRGYVSMVLGDPWEGAVDVAEVVAQGRRLLEAGCFELSLGDTIGVGTAGDVQALIGAFADEGIGPERLAVHFHDTYGQGLANVLAALELGVTVVDAAAGGLGGCPFAHSATGNLATEDLVWMLDGLGISTGVDVRAVAQTSRWLSERTGIALPGRAATALA